MGRLIDDLLEFARLARADIHRQKVDISSTSREIAEEVARWWPDTHVDLVVQPDIWAVADPGLLRMVLVNLLDNAWKFSSEAAGPRVEVGIERGWCYIKDNGAGFDAQFAHKLFLPFERLHSAKQFPGTGIGLASVKRIVNRHGGEVRAEGQIGKGATIYFKFDAGREAAIGIAWPWRSTLRTVLIARSRCLHTEPYE
jgi:signal transduction histidine kinase